jgi:glutathione S-transferase
MRTIVIGDKNLSSWSMRPWLVLAKCGVPFDELVIRLDRPDTKARLAAETPHGKVPVLRDDGLVIWESLAICEHLAERHPEAKLWPSDPAARARARSVATEMHAGFAALRREMPCNVALRTTKAPTEEVQKDVARLVAIFRTEREAHAGAGPYLFGAWSIADAFFTPVATRFRSYGVRIDEPIARAYCETLLADPAFIAWERGAIAEKETAT